MAFFCASATGELAGARLPEELIPVPKICAVTLIQPSNTRRNVVSTYSSVYFVVIPCGRIKWFQYYYNSSFAARKATKMIIRDNLDHQNREKCIPVRRGVKGLAHTIRSKYATLAIRKPIYQSVNSFDYQRFLT